MSLPPGNCHALAISACGTHRTDITAGHDTALPPIRFGHVALSVSNLEASMRWYGQTLGFAQASQVYDIAVDNSPLGQVAAGLFGTERKPFRIVQLKARDGLSLELFEILDRSDEQQWKPPARGILHFAVVTASFEETITRLELSGSRRIVGNESNLNRRVAFYTDPDGNVIEIGSTSW